MQTKKRKMCKKEEYTIMRIWILRVIPVSTTPISLYSCCFFFMQFATPTKSGNATHIWKERHPHIRILLYTTTLTEHKMSLLLNTTGSSTFCAHVCNYIAIRGGGTIWPPPQRGGTPIFPPQRGDFSLSPPSVGVKIFACGAPKFRPPKREGGQKNSPPRLWSAGGDKFQFPP